MDGTGNKDNPFGFTPLSPGSDARRRADNYKASTKWVPIVPPGDHQLGQSELSHYATLVQECVEAGSAELHRRAPGLYNYTLTLRRNDQNQALIEQISLDDVSTILARHFIEEYQPQGAVIDGRLLFATLNTDATTVNIWGVERGYWGPGSFFADPPNNTRIDFDSVTLNGYSAIDVKTKTPSILNVKGKFSMPAIVDRMKSPNGEFGQLFFLQAVKPK